MVTVIHFFYYASNIFIQEYSISLINGEFEITEQSAKDAAIDEIKAQPFFSPKLV
jgi:hypothetical protein